MSELRLIFYDLHLVPASTIQRCDLYKSDRLLALSLSLSPIHIYILSHTLPAYILHQPNSKTSLDIIHQTSLYTNQPKMHFNILLTLSTLTALSSNAAAQSPLDLLNVLGPASSQVVPSSQTPGPSSTPIPTFVKRLATPTAFPSTTPVVSTPVPHITPSKTPSSSSGVPHASVFPL